MLDKLVRLEQIALKRSEGKNDVMVREGNLIVGLDMARHDSERCVSTSMRQNPDGSIEILAVNVISPGPLAR